MKRVDELRISPMPWESHRQFVIANDDGSVIAATNIRDARLIAAAPELYEALRKMQECFDYIRSTAWFMDANFASIIKMNEVQNEAVSVLAKASGEEAK